MLYTASPHNNERPPEQPEEPDLSPADKEKMDWLVIARDAYETSEDWFTAAVRHDIERNVAHFQNRHAPGSKYFSDSYKYRSKSFRPKTRSVIRKNEALAATAYFATSNILNIKPEDPSDIMNRVSAEINQELLQYRLENTIPWYKVLLGAYQGTMVNRICISHQFWDYRESTRMVPMYDETGQAILNEDGSPAMEEEVTVVKDTPWSELRPVENVRFSPSADWMDPANTSPYIIDRIPMDMGTVKDFIKNSGKSKIKWYDVDDRALLSSIATKETDNSVERQRANAGIDPDSELKYQDRDFDTIWIHRNIIKKDGRDWIFYTAGTSELLSEPIPLEEEYPHLGYMERPYVIGFSVMEAHKQYPQSIADLISNLQQQTNELSNQRFDNVSLVLNRRYYVKRGQNVDLKALQRNVPGGVVLTNNIDQDVRSEAPPEVTGSSYQEQDRLNADIDEVAGNFSVGSVGTNRQLNETVGGMELMSADADILTEYQLRTFNETWVIPVLKQLIRLEQRHETDEAIFNMIGRKIEMWERFGVNEILDDMIQGDMKVEVNVGFGATNPSQRLKKLATAFQTAGALIPNMMQRLDEEEVGKEIFGAVGYKDASRFFVPEVPEEEQPEPPMDPNIQLEILRGQNQANLETLKFEQAIYLEELRTENDLRKDEMGLQKDMSDKALKMEMEERKMAQQERDAERKARLDEQKNKVRLAEQGMKQRNENKRFQAELDVKRRTGEGI